MRRLLIIPFAALMLLVSVAGVAPAVHAEGHDVIPEGQTDFSGASDGTGYEASYEANPEYTPAAAQNEINKGAGKPAQPDADPNSGYNMVMQKVLELFAWLVGVSAITLNYAVYYTVVTMGSYVSGLSAIGITWEILRDIGNIFLIFGFLAVGITTILNVDWYGGGKKMLPMMFIAAIFLNFSLFFTEAIIDTGNLFATQFYQQINGGTIKPPNMSLQAVTEEGISNKIMSQLGLQTLYAGGNPKLLQDSNPWLVGFMGILLFIVTAFVMFALAFVLIARFVILIFLIILAPVGFAGLAVPQLAGRAKEWWHKLFEQTITAPVLLLMLYVALRVITDARFLTGFGQATTGPSATGFVGNANLAGFGTFMLSFIVAMGLLIAVVIQSKSLSAFGASFASKAAGALSFGATAWAGRAVVGTGIGRGLLGNRFIKRGAVSDNALIKYGSRSFGFVGKRLQNRTFDVRNAPGAATGLGKLGIEAGTASQLTAKQVQEKQYGLKPTKEWFREASKEYEKDAKELEKKRIVSDPTDPDFEKTLKKMSADELSELRGIRKGLAPYVEKLSPAKYDELQKGDKLIQPEKDALKATWESQFTPVAAATTLGRFKTEEIASLDGTVLATVPVVAALGPTEFEAIRRKGNLTLGERRSMRAHMNAAAAADPAYAAEIVEYFSPGHDPRGERDKYWNV